MIKKLAITGGTHGNELTGVYLVKKWKRYPELLKRRNFKTLCLHTNEQSIKEVRRYIDQDLNRSFKSRDLSDESLETHEAKLAKKLNALLGPKGSDTPNVDFIVDLHTTTANMGLSIVVSNESALTWKAIAYLCQMEPALKVYRWQGDEEGAFVDSMAPHGFAIEVGAVPQGVLRADLFLQTEALIYHLLDFFEKFNEGEHFTYDKRLEIYDHQKLVDYPRDSEGDITAMVHEKRQDKDFTLITSGEPIFLMLSGETVCYEGEPYYTIFINEAAYYEKGFAMCLAKKVQIEIEI
ncbi:MAG TPA: aspartoacylase [Sulfurovum sp.]|nr:aspartoacylase [Sulfurovum sp.]